MKKMILFLMASLVVMTPSFSFSDGTEDLCNEVNQCRKEWSSIMHELWDYRDGDSITDKILKKYKDRIVKGKLMESMEEMEALLSVNENLTDKAAELAESKKLLDKVFNGKIDKSKLYDICQRASNAYSEGAIIMKKVCGKLLNKKEEEMPSNKDFESVHDPK